MTPFDTDIAQALERCPISLEEVSRLAYWWKFYGVAMSHTALSRLGSPDPDVADIVQKLNSLNPEDEPRSEYARSQVYGAYAQFFPADQIWPCLSAFFTAFERRWAPSGAYTPMYLHAEQRLSDLIGGQLIVTRGRVLTRSMINEAGRIRQEVLDADRLKQAIKDAIAASRYHLTEQIVRYLAGLWRLLALSRLTEIQLHAMLLEHSPSLESRAAYSMLITSEPETRSDHVEHQLYYAYVHFFGMDAATAVNDLLALLQDDRAYDACETESQENIRKARTRVNTYTGAQLDITSGSIVIADE